MKNFRTKLENGSVLHFQDKLSHLEESMAFLWIDYMQIDFEFHYRSGDKQLTVIREFHINSDNHFVRDIEKALFNYLSSLGYFELCYEDGIPCLTKTINFTSVSNPE